jgi:hypothetical protein
MWQVYPEYRAFCTARDAWLMLEGLNDVDPFVRYPPCYSQSPFVPEVVSSQTSELRGREYSGVGCRCWAPEGDVNRAPSRLVPNGAASQQFLSSLFAGLVLPIDQDIQ